MTSLLGAAEGRGTRVQEWELLDAATWSAGQYAGLSPHHTTLPPTKSTPSLRKDFKLVGLCFPPMGGFYRVVVDRGESKGQDRGKCRTYARSKGYEAETISQPLSWRQDMIQRLSR